MRIYWTLKSIPELSNVPAADRGRVWRAVSWRTFLHWQTWAGVVILGVAVGAGAYGGLQFNDLMIALVMLAACGAIGGIVCVQIMIEMARPYLRDLVNERAGSRGGDRP